MNIFARYSYAKFAKDGPSAFGAGGGPGVVDLGGNTRSRTRAWPWASTTRSSTTSILDVRFGWFRYNVNVLPNDYGTNPALDAGIPGMNFPDDPFTSGLPGGFIRGNAATMSFGTALGDETGRCNCPLEQDEKQYQFVTNLTKVLRRQAHGQDRRRRAARLQPARAERQPPLGRDRLQRRADAGTERRRARASPRSCWATSPATGATSAPARTRARRSGAGSSTPRTPGAPTNKLTINYGLRLEDIMPQTINDPGNAGYLDIQTGEMKVVGVGRDPD